MAILADVQHSRTCESVFLKKDPRRMHFKVSVPIGQEKKQNRKATENLKRGKAAEEMRRRIGGEFT